MQPLLTTRAASELLCLDQRTLERFRVAGTGPRFVKMGKSIRYRPAIWKPGWQRGLSDRPASSHGRCRNFTKPKLKSNRDLSDAA